MTIQLLLTTAGTDTGPFDLYENSTGPFNLFDSNVAKVDLTTVPGYTTIVPPGTTVVRIKSKGLCTNYIDITLTQSTTTSTTTSPVLQCDCYSLYALQDPILPELGVTFYYVDCYNTFQTILVDVFETVYVCSKILPAVLAPTDPSRGVVIEMESTAPCGGCPPQSTTSTTTVITYLSYELYYCGTTIPSIIRIPYTGSLFPGDIIKATDNNCYTVIGPSVLSPNVAYVSTHTTCLDCESS